MTAGEFAPDVVELIWDRDQGRCVDCGVQLRRERRAEAFDGWSVQHREARGTGGGKRGRRPWLVLASNGGLMCGTGTTGCHGDTETKRRGRAYALGFAIKTGIRRPSEIPMRHAVRGWVLLDDEGGWEPVEAPRGQEMAA
ncbi:hypothetical protein [Microbacterium rhizomatis]|uniref:HNH endonuclease n=1 Tax=Microbacterium rhizomatis TaxID=1631477 RepID=A0A5J5J234_9MICO|nr:hypothetical protein [Microbacterium rhizomatis]KAA9110161.1 hypothetical protein F6B43_00160 [Microbacterium rhizomatis]